MRMIRLAILGCKTNKYNTRQISEFQFTIFRRKASCGDFKLVPSEVEGSTIGNRKSKISSKVNLMLVSVRRIMFNLGFNIARTIVTGSLIFSR